jgi:hypothetical protein
MYVIATSSNGWKRLETAGNYHYRVLQILEVAVLEIVDSKKEVIR